MIRIRPINLLLPESAAGTLLSACAGLCVLIGSAAALAEPVSETTAQPLDRHLQDLKQEALQLNSELRQAEQTTLYADGSRATLYVSVKVPGFLLDEITFRINDRDPLTHTYTESESKAFLRDGWHRLLRLRLDPGNYRLQAEFRGHFADARPGDPPVKGKQEILFDKGASDLDLVLPVSRNTRLDKPTLSEISRLESRLKRPGRNVWLPQPERFETVLDAGSLGGEADPRYRTAVFLRHDQRYLSALGELLEIVRDAPDPWALPPAVHWLMAECYTGFGLEPQAARILERLAAASSDPLTLARARLQLARFEYQRGYLPQAAASLRAQRERLPEELLDEWRLLLANTLLAQGRYNEAVELLNEGDAEQLTPSLRYNLAVALIRDGRIAEGRRQLNRVGTMDVTNLDTLTLRDKANLTLGYQYLRAQQGANAKAVFVRIRQQGPFSNHALLGLGWAEMAPVAAAQGDVPVEAEGKNTDDSLGTLLRPGYVDSKSRNPLKLEAPAGNTLSPEEHDAMLRALIPWVELGQRDFMYPATQEGLLAIPWALDRLQAYEQSLKYYLDAITALETARKRMDEAMKSIKGARMVETIVRRDPDSERGWKWRLVDLPDTPETYFLQSLLAEHRFQEALKNFRDARLLTRNLDSWKTRLAELERTPPAASARPGRNPDTAGPVVWLSYAMGLGAPGAFDAPLRASGAAPLDLRILEAPQAFEGMDERLRPLRERLENLRPKIAAAGADQGLQLRTVSIKELEGQKKQIERYLTEARFAVARIYDRQSKPKSATP